MVTKISACSCDEIYELTPYVDANRTLEIKKYLKEHEIEQYVILDDELIGEELQEHQVFLDLYQGLQEEHIIPTINILNGNLGFYPSNIMPCANSDSLTSLHSFGCLLFLILADCHV